MMTSSFPRDGTRSGAPPFSCACTAWRMSSRLPLPFSHRFLAWRYPPRTINPKRTHPHEPAKPVPRSHHRRYSESRRPDRPACDQDTASGVPAAERLAGLQAAGEMREPAAYGFVQAARRDECRDEPAGQRYRCGCLFQRQPCAGRGPRRQPSRHQRHHRDARGCTGAEDRGHKGLWRGSGDL